MRRSITTAVVAVCAGFLGGCGEAGPKLVPVTGLVTLNNKPLEGATIQFVPDNSNKEGRPAEDITGPQGNYKLMTNGRSGIVSGKYKVLITKSPTSALSGPAAEAHKDDPFMAKLSAEGPDAVRSGKKKSADAETIEDEFEREVPPNGGEFDFDVKGKASTGAAPAEKK